jgi:TIR domain/Pentapeptide repeats (8 copies)
MANDEHVAMLKNGVDAWNKWRSKSLAEHPDLAASLSKAYRFRSADLIAAYLVAADLTPADLTGADLTGADLIRANLAKACLRNANLVEADLSSAYLVGANLAEADLFRAHLHGAKLIGADLTGANLVHANLAEANLAGANLSRAILPAANLTDANLTGANLTEAVLLKTVFGGTVLTEVQGLDRCRHMAPSVIDFRTLQNSGPLPIAFLRGVGLPDGLIEYLPSLLTEAIQLYSCFISYSSKDQAFAERLHADLQNKGVRCWFAPHDMPIGAKIIDALDEAIRLRDKVLLILSKDAIESDWVEGEVTRALDEERTRKQAVLVPVRIDDTVMHTSEAWARLLRGQRNIGDFSGWKDHVSYQKCFERLMRDLRVESSS